MKDALRIEDLVVSYGGIDAVKGISLAVPAGGTICLIGANGAGKTSVMRAVSGLVRAKSGSIRFFGDDLIGKHPAKMAGLGLAHVPEGRETFQKLSVHDNLRMGGIRLSSKEFAAGMDEICETFPRLADRRDLLCPVPASEAARAIRAQRADGRHLFQIDRVKHRLRNVGVRRRDEN